MAFLRLHPILPASRRLVSQLEREAAQVAARAGPAREEAVRAGSARLAGAVLADGSVSEGELALLDRMRRKLDPQLPGAASPQRQAARELYDALEVNFATRTVGHPAPDVEHPHITVRGLLPASRRLARALEGEAERIAALPGPEREAAVGAALDALGKLSSNQGRFAQRLGFAARDTGQFLPEAHPQKPYWTALQQLGLGASARSAFDPVRSISW